jgi:hypothetical protein
MEIRTSKRSFYDSSTVKKPVLTSKTRKWPNTSQRYDPSAVIRAQNAMGARAKSRKPYDASSAVFTTRKKCVTAIRRVRK